MYVLLLGLNKDKDHIDKNNRKVILWYIGLKNAEKSKFVIYVKNEFILIRKNLKINLDNKGEKSYYCPHYNKELKVYLRGNEDVDTEKV